MERSRQKSIRGVQAVGADINEGRGDLSMEVHLTRGREFADGVPPRAEGKALEVSIHNAREDNVRGEQGNLLRHSGLRFRVQVEGSCASNQKPLVIPKGSSGQGFTILSMERVDCSSREGNPGKRCL